MNLLWNSQPYLFIYSINNLSQILLACSSLLKIFLRSHARYLMGIWPYTSCFIFNSDHKFGISYRVFVFHCANLRIHHLPFIFRLTLFLAITWLFWQVRRARFWSQIQRFYPAWHPRSRLEVSQGQAKPSHCPHRQVENFMKVMAFLRS